MMVNHMVLIRFFFKWSSYFMNTGLPIQKVTKNNHENCTLFSWMQIHVVPDVQKKQFRTLNKS